MKVRKVLALSGVAVAAGVVLGLPAVAAAGERVVPGAACGTTGATGWHNGEKYRCVQKPGEDCPHWAWIYNPNVPRGHWSPRPAGPCPSCPSPSPFTAGSPSPSPTPSTAGTPSATSTNTAGNPTTPATTTPAGDSDGLPVTGPSAAWTAGIGGLLLAGGLLARRFGKRRT